MYFYCQPVKFRLYIYTYYLNKSNEHAAKVNKY